MSILNNILRAAASDYTYAPLTPGPDGLSHTPIPKDRAYISIFLRSMRIVDVRKMWNKFYPVVHSYISIPHLGGQLAEFQTVTSPSRLSELDASRLDRVINLNHRLLGPMPYRGGDLKIEIGLFSVKSSDLAKPFLGVLQDMAVAAGVSFVSVAKPFVDPLKKGLEHLTGSSDLNLEIGLATTFDTPETGYFFVMRAKRELVKSSNLRVAEDFRLVDNANEVVGNYPYLVFSVEMSETRDDWFRIAEIANIHNELQTAVRKGKREDVDEIFSMFRRTVLTSPDLLARDAQRLVKQINGDLAAALPTSMTSGSIRQIRSLESIHLFG